MTPQQTEQLIKELENRLDNVNKEIEKYSVFPFEKGRKLELLFALGIIKQTTVNRSSI